MARRRRWAEEQMRELVQEHERSGVSLKAFAAAAGVPYTTLAWWRARLRGDGEPRLVPVVVVKDEFAGIEIVVRDVVVRVPHGTSAEATARLARQGVSTADGPDAAAVAVLHRDRVANLNELADALHPYFVDPVPSAELRAQHFTDAARAGLVALDARLADCPWHAAELGRAVKETAAAAGLKMPQLAIPLRVALLGQPQSPSIDAVLEVLGRERVRARLARVPG